MCKEKRSCAFTLIEIMVVITIMFLLTTIGTHVYKNLRLETQADALINELKIIEAAVRMYYYDHNGEFLPNNYDLKNTPELQPYFPSNFKNSPPPLGGYWRYYNAGEGFAIVCDGMTNWAALQLARDKMIREDPQMNGRLGVYPRGSGYTLDYYIKYSPGVGNGQNFF